jgi:hypothetical protein
VRVPCALCRVPHQMTDIKAIPSAAPASAPASTPSIAVPTRAAYAAGLLEHTRLRTAVASSLRTELSEAVGVLDAATVEHDSLKQRTTKLETDFEFARNEPLFAAIGAAVGSAVASDVLHIVCEYSFVRKVDVKALMLGIDGAGKTTILYACTPLCGDPSAAASGTAAVSAGAAVGAAGGTDGKSGAGVAAAAAVRLPATIPTIGFNVETLHLRNAAVLLWDVGGQSKLLPLWRYERRSARVHTRERARSVCCVIRTDHSRVPVPSRRFVWCVVCGVCAGTIWIRWTCSYTSLTGRTTRVSAPHRTASAVRATHAIGAIPPSPR